MTEILSVLLSKMIDEDEKIRLWARVLPWFLMACVGIVSLAFAYSLIK